VATKKRGPTLKPIAVEVPQFVRPATVPRSKARNVKPAVRAAPRAAPVVAPIPKATLRKPKTPPPVARVPADAQVAALRKKFQRLTGPGTTNKVRRSFDEAASALTRRAGAVLRASGPQAMPGIVSAAQRNLAERLGGVVAHGARESQRDSLRGLSQMMHKLEGGSALDDNAAMEKLLTKRAGAIRTNIDRLMLENSKDMAQSVHTAMQDPSLIGAKPRQLQAAFEDSLESQFYKIERVARTEAAVAYNAAQHDGIALIAEDFPDMMIRWTEHVSDDTWEPTDSKTAPDSIAMHGQVKAVRGVFVAPADPRIPAEWHGKTYAFPPNRPNDRAVVLPWRKAWGIPAWIINGDGRKWLTRR